MQLSNSNVSIPVPPTAPQPLFSHPHGSPPAHRPVPSSNVRTSSTTTPSSSSSSYQSDDRHTVSIKSGTRGGSTGGGTGTGGGSFGGGSPRGGSNGGMTRSHIPPPPPPLSYMSVYSGLFNSSSETTVGMNNNSMHLHSTSKIKGKTNTPLVTTLVMKRTNSAAGNVGICIPKMTDKMSSSS